MEKSISPSPTLKTYGSGLATVGAVVIVCVFVSASLSCFSTVDNEVFVGVVSVASTASVIVTFGDTS